MSNRVVLYGGLVPAAFPAQSREDPRIWARPATTRSTSALDISGQIGSEITRSYSRVAAGKSDPAKPQQT